MSEPEKSKKSAEKPAAKKTPAETYELPASWGSAWKIAAGVGVVGTGATLSQVFGGGESAVRASYSYLFGFCVFLTIALGSLFFVLKQHLTSAGWSVTTRRTAELLASALPVFFVLFLPILARVDAIYPWTHPAEGGHEGGGEEHQAEPKKEGRLTIPFVKEAHAQEAPAGQPHAAQPAAPGASAGAGAHKDGSGQGHGNGGGQGHGNGSGAGHVAHQGGAEHHGGAAMKHADPEEVEHAEILEEKQHGWLSKNFWMGRAVAYFVIWALLSWFFFKNSVEQDKTKNALLTVKAQKWAPLCTVLFGLSLTFAAFDWIMSLDPMWFSTIFGVYIFATSVVSSYGVIIVLTMMLRDSGPLKKVVTVEHYHDLGKLMFGFNVFWAYIGFSQMMLIWYAALPAETPFYHKRWETPSSLLLGNHSGDFWTNISVAVLVLHFVVPFLFLISRNTKRKLGYLKMGAAWMVLIHMLDMFWFVLPNFEPNTKAAGFSIAWTDFTALLGVGGIYFAVVFFRMTKHALIPTGDPRLARSVAFINA